MSESPCSRRTGRRRCTSRRRSWTARRAAPRTTTVACPMSTTSGSSGSRKTAPRGERPAGLALAARASASFPGAFEPRSCASAARTTTVRRQHHARRWTSTCRRPVPLGGRRGPAGQPADPTILDTIFERPAEDKQVRRVLLYVVPDPGGNPSRPTDPPREQPELDPAVVAAERTGPGPRHRAQPVDRRRPHGDPTTRPSGRHGDSRLRLAQLGIRLRGGDETAEPYPTDEAWSDYKALQGRMQVEPAVSALMRPDRPCPEQILRRGSMSSTTRRTWSSPPARRQRAPG